MGYIWAVCWCWEGCLLRSVTLSFKPISRLDEERVGKFKVKNSPSPGLSLSFSLRMLFHWQSTSRLDASLASRLALRKKKALLSAMRRLEKRPRLLLVAGPLFPNRPWSQKAKSSSEGSSHYDEACAFPRFTSQIASVLMK